MASDPASFSYRSLKRFQQVITDEASVRTNGREFPAIEDAVFRKFHREKSFRCSSPPPCWFSHVL